MEAWEFVTLTLCGVLGQIVAGILILLVCATDNWASRRIWPSRAGRLRGAFLGGIAIIFLAAFGAAYMRDFVARNGGDESWTIAIGYLDGLGVGTKGDPRPAPVTDARLAVGVDLLARAMKENEQTSGFLAFLLDLSAGVLIAMGGGLFGVAINDWVGPQRRAAPADWVPHRPTALVIDLDFKNDLGEFLLARSAGGLMAATDRLRRRFSEVVGDESATAVLDEIKAYRAMSDIEESIRVLTDILAGLKSGKERVDKALFKLKLAYGKSSRLRV